MKTNNLLPLFDTLEQLNPELSHPLFIQYTFAREDFLLGYEFLRSYRGSQATFGAYRREIERLLHWAWQVSEKSILALKRADIEDYIDFCQNPPKTWISLSKVHKFIKQDGQRVPNKNWRPFVVTLPKQQLRGGREPKINDYSLSEAAVRDIFAILSSFYNFLIQDERAESNPVSLVRQKSRYIKKRQGPKPIRRLSELQWQYLLASTEIIAQEDPKTHERTRFMLCALFLMYLRISELTASERWVPQMNNFYCDHDSNWWFKVVGKGNKERDIAVSETMLQVLRRWRTHLGLPGLPTAADTMPLIPKLNGKGPLTNTSYIRKIIQRCFDAATSQLQTDGFVDESHALQAATVHWLRHTGISEDVKHRPREHVRDDAGHSSSVITDRYIDIDKRARHQSAQSKPLT